MEEFQIKSLFYFFEGVKQLKQKSRNWIFSKNTRIKTITAFRKREKPKINKRMRIGGKYAGGLIRDSIKDKIIIISKTLRLRMLPHWSYRLSSEFHYFFVVFFIIHDNPLCCIIHIFFRCDGLQSLFFSPRTNVEGFMAIKKIKNIFNLLCSSVHNNREQKRNETRQIYILIGVLKILEKSISIEEGFFFLLKLMIVQSTTKLFTLLKNLLLGLSTVGGRIFGAFLTVKIYLKFMTA